jgi:hypothetical protein
MSHPGPSSSPIEIPIPTTPPPPAHHHPRITTPPPSPPPAVAYFSRAYVRGRSIGQYTRVFKALHPSTLLPCGQPGAMLSWVHLNANGDTEYKPLEESDLHDIVSCLSSSTR